MRWSARERHGKAAACWPTNTREEYSAWLMRDALDGGNSGLVQVHFLEQITDEESATLRRALRRLASTGVAMCGR